MEHHNDNNLNEFFKSRLEDSTPADNGWNVPPLSVLDAALDQIPHPPKRNKLLIPLIIIGLITLGLAILTIQNAVEISSLSEKIDTLSIEVTNHQAHINDLASIQESKLSSAAQIPALSLNETETMVSQDQSIDVDNQITQTPLTARVPQYVNNQSVNKIQQVPVERKQLIGSLIPTPPTHNGSEDVRHSPPITQAAAALPVLTDDTSNPKRQLLGLSPILANQASVLSQQSSPAIDLRQQVSPILSKETQNTRQPMSLLLTGSHLSSDIRMTNIDVNNTTLTQYDDFYPGVGFSVGVSVPLNKTLSINTSIGYSRLNNRSRYESDFIYYENNTIQTGMGNLMHLSNPTVETPMMDYSDEIVLRVNDNQITNGEMLDHVTEISDTYQVVQLSTGISAEILRYKKLSVHTGIGLTGNYILNISQALDTKMLSNSNVMMEEITNLNLTQNINRKYLSGSLSLGLQYDLTQAMYLRFNSRYEKGITSLRIQRSSEQPKSFINSFGSEMTIGYAF